MTFPYIVEDGRSIRCLCKGCGAELWRESIDDHGARVRVRHPEYGDLYLSMANREGVLSQHSTPCCPSCADRLLGKVALQPVGEAEEWWGADVFHWFVEERCIGSSPDRAYQVAMHLQGGRHVVRVLRYERG